MSVSTVRLFATDMPVRLNLRTIVCVDPPASPWAMIGLVSKLLKKNDVPKKLVLYIPKSSVAGKCFTLYVHSASFIYSHLTFPLGLSHRQYAIDMGIQLAEYRAEKQQLPAYPELFMQVGQCLLVVSEDVCSNELIGSFVQDEVFPLSGCDEEWLQNNTPNDSRCLHHRLVSDQFLPPGRGAFYFIFFSK